MVGFEAGLTSGGPYRYAFVGATYSIEDAGESGREIREIHKIEGRAPPALLHGIRPNVTFSIRAPLE